MQSQRLEHVEHGAGRAAPVPFVAKVATLPGGRVCRKVAKVASRNTARGAIRPRQFLVVGGPGGRVVPASAIKRLAFHSNAGARPRPGVFGPIRARGIKWAQRRGGCPAVIIHRESTGRGGSIASDNTAAEQCGARRPDREHSRGLARLPKRCRQGRGVNSIKPAARLLYFDLWRTIGGRCDASF
jgi:hypothetical protein